MSFEDEYSFDYITSQSVVEEYRANNDVFVALLTEVKELSKKKPDATMSQSKVKIINRVLEHLLVVLAGQPDAKYLELLDDEVLPQMSDALLVMVQFHAALKSFYQRHYRRVDGIQMWITQGKVEQLRRKYEEIYEDQEAYDEEDEDDVQ